MLLPSHCIQYVDFEIKEYESGSKTNKLMALLGPYFVYYEQNTVLTHFCVFCQNEEKKSNSTYLNLNLLK